MNAFDKKLYKKSLDWITEGLGALHILLSFFYIEQGIYLIVGLHILCTGACFLALYFLRQESFYRHMLTLYLCEIIEIVAGCILVGWSAGMQIQLVGLTALVFLAEYLGRPIGIKSIPTLPVGIADFAVYVAVFPFFFHRAGLLGIPESDVVPIELLWGIPTFGLIVAGLILCLRMTSDSERMLQNKAETDELTGLLNRAGYDRLCAELDLESCVLLIVDTDKFKGINDRFGHATGDRVLKKIAMELKKSFRRYDHVCRIGGDEFTVIMTNADLLENSQISDRITSVNLALSHTSYDGLPYVSVSVGAARSGSAGDWTALFKQADSALYKVKAAGGRGILFCEEQ